MKHGFLKRCRHRAEYVAFRMFTTALDLVGPRTATRVAGWMAALLTSVLPDRWTRSNVARANIRRAFPEMDDAAVERTVRGMWSHILLLLVEIAQVSRRMSRQNVDEFLQFRHRWKENHDLLFESDRPVIQIGGHLGNWEVGSIAFGHRGVNMGVVARELDNPLLDEWFCRLREQSGHTFLSKNHDYPKMVEILESGGRLAMLCDQDAGPKGVFVPFLGKPASTFRSIALLAMQHRAHVCVGYSCRVPNTRDNGWFTYELACVDVIDATEYEGVAGVEELTARFTAGLERAVRMFPEQYFWLHRRWKTSPTDRCRREDRGEGRRRPVRRERAA